MQLHRDIFGLLHSKVAAFCCIHLHNYGIMKAHAFNCIYGGLHLRAFFQNCISHYLHSVNLNRILLQPVLWLLVRRCGEVLHAVRAPQEDTEARPLR